MNTPAQKHQGIAVVIANWNGKEMLEQTLHALERQTVQPDRVIVVDNGSTDGSVEMIKKKFEFVQVIALDNNTGYAYPNNLGIQEALADASIQYIITLNNDTVADAHYIEEMRTCAQRHPEAASIQPKVINFYDPKRIDAVGILVYPDMSAMNKGQGQEDHGQYDTEQEIFAPSASAALYTRTGLERVVLPGNNYFDSDYFAYYEDVDLAWRLRLAGFSSWYTPNAVVRHMHSATGKSHSPFKAFHIHRNHYYNMIKNFPILFLVPALLFMPIRYVLLLSSVLRKKGPSAKLAEKSGNKYNMVTLVFKSWRDIIVHLPSLLQKRRFIRSTRVVKNAEIHRWLKDYRANLRFIIFGAE